MNVANMTAMATIQGSDGARLICHLNSPPRRITGDTEA